MTTKKLLGALVLACLCIGFIALHGVADAGPLGLMAATAAAPAIDIGEAVRRFEVHNAELKTLLEQAGAKVKSLTEKSEESSDRIRELEQTVSRRRSGGGSFGSNDETPGALVAASEALKSFGGANRRGKFTVNVKTITSLAASAGALIRPDVRTDITMLPQRRLTVRNLVAPGTTLSNLVQYPRQTVRNLNAEGVSEGTAKPESNIEFEMANAPVITIAHWTKASKQAIDDAPQLQATIDGELRYGLGIEEETQMLLGDNSSAQLYGIIPQATGFSSGSPFQPVQLNDFDVLLQALAQAQQALLPSTGIVVNDVRLMKMRSIKDTNGNYVVSGGPFGGPVTSIWGVPTVGTPAIGYDKFIAGAFRDGAQVFDRQDATVEVSTEDGDNFRLNLLTVRGEERLAFTVKRPAAFIYGAFPNVT